MTQLLTSLTERGAEWCGEAVAATLAGASLSYAELAERSERVARSLGHLGVRAGDCVGLYQPQTLDTLIALHGILRAGAAYVPIDPMQPPQRAAGILDRCGINVTFSSGLRPGLLDAVLTQRRRQGIVVGDGTSNVTGESVDWRSVASGLADGQLPVVRDSDMAYVIFTSGSTGDPKGIVHTHGSAMAYALASARLYGLQREDRVAAIAPLHFDQSTFHLFAVPIVGARACLVSEAQLRLPASLARQLAQDHATVLYTVPYQLVQLLLRGGLEGLSFDSIRWVLFGGEPFPEQHLEAWMERLPGAKFSNVYGPAEVNQCTYFHVHREHHFGSDTIPVGEAWPVADVAIVDGEGNAVAPGETGELLVSSATMMDRYWGGDRDDPAVFDFRPGANGTPTRFFRSGDRFREDADGRLWFLGRMDRQVKVRGQRLDLEEVEEALRQHRGVAEAAAYLVSRSQDQRIVEAAVIPVPGTDLSELAIRRYLAARLPPAAVPEQIAVRTELPRTGSDKIDRRALAAAQSHEAR